MEQYVYLYDQNTIELVDRGGLVPDTGNKMVREPLVTTFRCRGVPRQQAFSFTLMNVHTVPGNSRYEIQALAGMYRYVRNLYAGQEDDVILLGDFNQPEKYFLDLYAIPHVRAVIGSKVATNTRRNRSLDNIVFDHSRTREFTGETGVLDFMKRYNLTMEQAYDVSDHFPVFATFSIREYDPHLAEDATVIHR